jgi:hypothetical protein
VITETGSAWCDANGCHDEISPVTTVVSAALAVALAVNNQPGSSTSQSPEDWLPTPVATKEKQVQNFTFYILVYLLLVLLRSIRTQIVDGAGFQPSTLINISRNILKIK